MRVFSSLDSLAHGWQVLAVIFGSAALFTFCWYLSQEGLLDLAATGITFFAACLVRQLGGNLTRLAPKEFGRSAGLIDALRQDFSKWMHSRRLLSHAVLALAFTIVYLIGRYIASVLLTAIASPWLALTAGLIVAAAVASPLLVRELGRGLNTSRTPSTQNHSE